MIVVSLNLRLIVYSLVTFIVSLTRDLCCCLVLHRNVLLGLLLNRRISFLGRLASRSLAASGACVSSPCNSSSLLFLLFGLLGGLLISQRAREERVRVVTDVLGYAILVRALEKSQAGYLVKV